MLKQTEIRSERDNPYASKTILPILAYKLYEFHNLTA